MKKKAVKVASPKLLLKTRFWPSPSIIFAKCGQDPPRELGQAQKWMEGQRQGWRQATAYIESGPSRRQATNSAEQRSVQEANRNRDGDQHSYGISGPGTEDSRLGWNVVQGHGHFVVPGCLVRAIEGWWCPQDPEERKKKGHGEAEHQISDCVLETTGNKMNDGDVYSEKEEELAGNITLETPRGILFLSGGDIKLTITLIQRTKVWFIFQQQGYLVWLWGWKLFLREVHSM